MSTKYNKKRLFNKKNTVQMLLILFFVSGIVVGVVYARTNAFKVSNDLELYLQGFGGISAANSDMFLASFFKHLKLIVAIWFLAFVTFGGFVIFPLIMVKGASYGFAAVLMAERFRGYGFWICLILFLPQLVFMVPANLYVAKEAIFRFNGGETKDLASYAKVLLVGIFAAVVAAAVDMVAVNIAISLAA